MIEFKESLYPTYGQWLTVSEVLFENATDHQHLIIFRNESFGRVMALDGVVQTTEKDEFFYHEMLAHVPIVAHGAARDVLIIGGGDGGMLREVARHSEVERITQVEIDQTVVDMCARYLPNHSQGAFDDPRLDLVIADGMQFVKDTDKRYDVVISDSTDPIGPGEVLFTKSFYAGVKRCMKPGGVFVTQNGVAFTQLDELVGTARRFSQLFSDHAFYGASVPTYVGGIMAFGWGTDDALLRSVSDETLTQRFAATGIRTRYYTPQIHKAAFALPQFVLDAISFDS